MSTTTPEQAPQRVSLMLLVFIAFTGTLAMHIFVPVMPAAARDLRTDSQTIQLAITIYTLGLALGQLFYGPLSDVIGRRKAILGGIVVYIIGSVASGVATSPEFLIAARFLQALGGAGGLALTRVVVADTSKGAGATRGIAVLNMILLLGPGLAPVLGANISELVGWRGIFVALTLMALGTFIASLLTLPETGQPTRRFDASKALGGFRALLANGPYMRVVTGGAFGSTACYAYFVSAPFIMSADMGLSIQAVGYCIAATLAAAAAGTLITRSLVGRIDEKIIQRVFALLGLLTGLLFLIGALAHLLTPVSVVALSMLILFSAGGLGPITIGMSLRLAGPQAASASGLYGCFQMLSGVVCSFVAGMFTDHQLGCGLALFCAYLFCAVQLLRPSRR
ncbi:MAG: MFS transporter [Hyphomicrobiales bacterium]|nr:MAG: MFS transporter [Hyphomicrobiales bacterium]